MGMRPEGRDIFGVPSQVAPPGRYVEGGGSHPTLRMVVPYGHCRYAAFDRVFLLYLGFATPPILKSALRQRVVKISRCV